MSDSDIAVASPDIQRLSEIALVMQEKEAMVRVGQELLELCGTDWNHKIDAMAFDKKTLEFVEHLSNIAGFCDNEDRSAIWAGVRELTAMAIDPNRLENFTHTKMKLILTMAVGIQVDFAKRPFRVFGLDVGAFGARVKALVKR